MKFKILLLCLLVVGVTEMISPTLGVPIEVVYTGDSCDCPKNLNYMVNLPPPPKKNEYKTSEFNYKIDVPMQAKAKVTYSFDFTVQEPKIPPPIEQEKWDLYAKIDRITAHKKDCYATNGSSSNTCSCHRCKTMRNNDNRYVLPENTVIRYRKKFQQPNSISKIENSTSKLLAIFLQPLEQPQTLATKSRNKRDISRIFLRGNKNNNNIKRPERLVKQYNKRLLPRLLMSPQIAKQAPQPSKPTVPVRRRPFENLKNMLVPLSLRQKRDIKGEYDLIEKEREQLDLTLPEIIQFMPETLDPDFKRGQCQFSEQCGSQDQIPASEGEGDEDENDNTKETLENVDSESNDTTGDSENDISSTHTKRNVAHYGCGSAISSYNSPIVNPTPTPSYSYQSYEPPSVNTNYDDIPRPFSLAAAPYDSDPSPQQYVGAPYNGPIVTPEINTSPIVGATHYNPYGRQAQSNAQLDRIIADIVNRHSDFIDASTHHGGALVDPTKDQEYQNKKYMKTLWDGHWQKWLVDAPVHNSYYHVPQYRVPALAAQSY